jgi:hypothetical protein
MKKLLIKVGKTLKKIEKKNKNMKKRKKKNCFEKVEN